MSMKVATNTAALNTQRYLGIASAAGNKALERLSSGYKINKAADDAAGIAIATKLNVKGVVIAKSIDNGNQAVAMLQTAEGGIGQISDILTRLKEIATQSASDNTSSADRTALDTERSNLEGEINKIAANTKYGTTALLNGSNIGTVGSVGASLTVGNGISKIDGANAAADTYTLTVSGTGTVLSLTDGTNTQAVTISKPSGLNSVEVNFSSLNVKITVNANLVDMSAANSFAVTGGSLEFQLGADNSANDRISVGLRSFTTGGAVLNFSGDISSKSNAQSYMAMIDTAVTELTKERGVVGAAQNQLTYHVSNLEAMYENTKAAESVIKDADFAREMAEFTKFQTIQQSGIAMLAQANQMPQQILSLLRG
jgi:flagellin